MEILENGVYQLLYISHLTFYVSLTQCYPFWQNIWMQIILNEMLEIRNIQHAHSPLFKTVLEQNTF